MNEYLNKLEKALRRLSEIDKQEILADYREHFEIGHEAGKTDEQIIESLGDPGELAKMYTALGATKKAHESKGFNDTLGMIGAIIRFKVGGGLVMAALYFAVVSVMIILFAGAVGIAIGGIGAVGYAVNMFVLGRIAYAFLGIFTAAVLISGGVLGLIACKKLWKLSVGNLSYVARKIMQKRVNVSELDTYKG